jgi:hypothetical protein
VGFLVVVVVDLDLAAVAVGSFAAFPKSRRFEMSLSFGLVFGST